MTIVRIGTRGSQLALWQARRVQALLEAGGEVRGELVIIKTTGDRLSEANLSQVGGKRLFVKEIEEALAAGAIDLAVHSAKDMPAVLPEGLSVGGVLPREDPRDALVLPAGGAPSMSSRAAGAAEALTSTAARDGRSAAGAEDPSIGGHGPAATALADDPPAGVAPRDVAAQGAASGAAAAPPGERGRDAGTDHGVAAIHALLPAGSRVGTSSVRRVAQLRRVWPGARFGPVRGNLDTRLRKLDEGQHDALVLAAAGLTRLGFAHRISALLPLSACVPAPGQGIIAIEIREGDERIAGLVEGISDHLALAALAAERAVVAALGGGCQAPIGAVAQPAAPGRIALTAVVFSLDGSVVLTASVDGAPGEADRLGRDAADRLLADGAAALLEAARRELGDAAGPAAAS
jgi:hydroxymethylbilane synthase